MPIVSNTEVIDGEEVTILIEVDEVVDESSPYDDLRGAGTDRVLTAARDVFGDGLELARGCARRVVSTIQRMDEKVRPDEFEVQLAIKFDSEVGAILTKASAGAQMQVTMKWIKSQEGQQS